MNRWGWAPALSLVLFLSMAAGAPAAWAQEVVSLDRVEELAGQGRTEEARAMLMTWWSETGGSAPRREAQRGLWLRGRLTVDPSQAELDYRRLVIEYPGGTYTDMALLRLAQSAYAAGDSAAAVAHVDRLAREYPTSATRREAEAWLATAGPVPPRIETADSVVASAVDQAGEGASTDEAADPPTESESPAVAPTPEVDAERGHFTVQLGAFSSEGRAEALLRRASDAGFDARLATIPGSSLIRVRVGVFDAQQGADAILRRLQDLGFTAALARDAHREARGGR